MTQRATTTARARRRARLSPKPAITQQLELTRRLGGGVGGGAGGGGEFEAFLDAAAARFDLRMPAAEEEEAEDDDDGGGAPANDDRRGEDEDADTALHVAAYRYDHDALLVLLARDGGRDDGGGGGGGIDARDGRGRTALHHASDAVDQLNSLVRVFFLFFFCACLAH